MTTNVRRHRNPAAQQERRQGIAVLSTQLLRGGLLSCHRLCIVVTVLVLDLGSSQSTVSCALLCILSLLRCCQIRHRVSQRCSPATIRALAAAELQRAGGVATRAPPHEQPPVFKNCCAPPSTRINIRDIHERCAIVFDLHGKQGNSRGSRDERRGAAFDSGAEPAVRHQKQRVRCSTGGGEYGKAWRAKSFERRFGVGFRS